MLNVKMNPNKAETKAERKPQRYIAIALALILVITGAIAFLTATDAKMNTFTVGSVDIELHENFNGTQDVASPSPELNHVLPGQTVEKEPWVVNTGSTKAWTYLVVGVPYSDIATISANSFSNSLTMPIKAFGIQENYNDATTSPTTWEAFEYDFPGNEISQANKANAIQLFNLVGLDTTHWTPLDDPFFSDDGHIYYVYGYQTKLDAAGTQDGTTVTQPLFTDVHLISEIGEAAPVIPSGNYVTLMRHGRAIAHLPIVYTLNGASIESTSTVDIESYADNDPTYLGFKDEKGVLQTRNLNAANLIIYNTVDKEITNPNPVLRSVYDGAERINGTGESDVPVKLVPANTESKAVIQRGLSDEVTYGRSYADQGIFNLKNILETYDISSVQSLSQYHTLRNPSVGVITDEEVADTYSDTINKTYWSGTRRDWGDMDDEGYPASVSGFEMWFVYGIHENCTLDDLRSIVRVQGDGYMLVSDLVDGKVTTGSVIEVYRSSDDSLVEKFHIILRGDINGDCIIDATDNAFARNECAGNTGWSLADETEWDPCKWKAGDLQQDGNFGTVDRAILYRIVKGTAFVDQGTGKITENT